MSREGRPPAESEGGDGGGDGDGVGGEDWDEDAEQPGMADLLDELVELQDTVDTEAEREQVRETMRVAMRVSQPGAFGRVIRGFDRGDIAEALLGSVIFGVPMLVESGTLEIGAFVAEHPPVLVGTAAFAVAMVVGILYVADIQDVRVHRPLFGFLPRRLVGVLGVSSITAFALMTAWGRVDWAEPTVALAQCVVAFVPMAIGAALGDILPGS